MLAVVLARKNFREYDQFITLFSAESGKIEVLAKAVKKINSKNSAHLEPCFLIEVEVVGNRDFNLLAKAEPIEVFKNIRLDLTKIRLVNYILNFLNKIIKPNHPEEALFSTLVGFLAFSHEQENINLFLIEAFIFKTLCHLGFYQELNKCVKCEQEIQMNKQGEYFFSLSSGGVLCQQVECHAEDVVKFDSEIWELLKNLMNKDWNFINNLQINSEDKEKIQVFVKNIGEYYLGFSIDVFCEV